MIVFVREYVSRESVTESGSVDMKASMKGSGRGRVYLFARVVSFWMAE